MIKTGSIDDVDVVVLFSNGLNGWSKLILYLVEETKKNFLF